MEGEAEAETKKQKSRVNVYGLEKITVIHNTTEILQKTAGCPQDAAALISVSSHYISDMYTLFLLICSLENSDLW